MSPKYALLSMTALLAALPLSGSISAAPAQAEAAKAGLTMSVEVVTSESVYRLHPFTCTCGACQG